MSPKKNIKFYKRSFCFKSKKGSLLTTLGLASAALGLALAVGSYILNTQKIAKLVSSESESVLLNNLVLTRVAQAISSTAILCSHTSELCYWNESNNNMALENFRFSNYVPSKNKGDPMTLDVEVCIPQFKSVTGADKKVVTTVDLLGCTDKIANVELRIKNINELLNLTPTAANNQSGILAGSLDGTDSASSLSDSKDEDFYGILIRVSSTYLNFAQEKTVSEITGIVRRPRFLTRIETGDGFCAPTCQVSSLGDSEADSSFKVIDEITVTPTATIPVKSTYNVSGTDVECGADVKLSCTKTGDAGSTFLETRNGCTSSNRSKNPLLRTVGAGCSCVCEKTTYSSSSSSLTFALKEGYVPKSQSFCVGNTKVVNNQSAGYSFLKPESLNAAGQAVGVSDTQTGTVGDGKAALSVFNSTKAVIPLRVFNDGPGYLYNYSVKRTFEKNPTYQFAAGEGIVPPEVFLDTFTGNNNIPVGPGLSSPDLYDSGLKCFDEKITNITTAKNNVVIELEAKHVYADVGNHHYDGGAYWKTEWTDPVYSGSVTTTTSVTPSPSNSKPSGTVTYSFVSVEPSNALSLGVGESAAKGTKTTEEVLKTDTYVRYATPVILHNTGMN